MLTTLFYSLLALDQTVAHVAATYGPWVYAFLFAVIFAETGLVVLPFLPGDSILFIAGAVVAASPLNVHLLVLLLIVAAIFAIVNTIIGTVSFGGSAAALRSASDCRISRFSFAIVRNACPTGVP